jgi:hypothetical protein
VDLYAIASGYAPRRAFELEHAELPRFAVLCAKLLAVLWLATGQVVYFRSAFVPFPGAFAFDAPRAAPLIVLVQLVAILTIVCSRFVRTGCVMLAVIIAALAALDQPLFSNNRWFCALVLGMIALGDGGRWARFQVALVYAAAAIDKLLSADWRSGWFLQTFTANLCGTGALGSFDGAPTTPLPATCWLAQQIVANNLAAQLCSLLVIATELAIAAGYLKPTRLVIPAVLGFHGVLLLVTGSTFGIFFYACIACSVLVLDQRPRT